MQTKTKVTNLGDIAAARVEKISIVRRGPKHRLMREPHEITAFIERHCSTPVVFDREQKVWNSDRGHREFVSFSVYLAD